MAHAIAHRMERPAPVVIQARKRKARPPEPTMLNDVTDVDTLVYTAYMFYPNGVCASRLPRRLIQRLKRIPPVDKMIEYIDDSWYWTGVIVHPSVTDTQKARWHML